MDDSKEVVVGKKSCEYYYLGENAHIDSLYFFCTPGIFLKFHGLIPGEDFPLQLKLCVVFHDSGYFRQSRI